MAKTGRRLFVKMEGNYWICYLSEKYEHMQIHSARRFTRGTVYTTEKE